MNLVRNQAKPSHSIVHACGEHPHQTMTLLCMYILHDIW